MEYIHQIWFQGENNIPNKYEKYRKSVKDMHPNVTVITWDENSILQLISKHFPEYYDWFNNLPLMIQKIDVAKCFILSIWGGIYVDMDIEIIKPLYELYENDKVVIAQIGLNYFENIFFQLFLKINMPLLNNGIIFSPARHSFWDFYIPFLKDTINTKPFILEKLINELYVAVTSGPASLTYAVGYYPNKEEIKIVEPKYLEPGKMGKNYSKDCYIIHHHELSWCSSIFKVFMDYITNSFLMGMLLIIFISIIMIVLIIYLVKK
jgi:inositol phosphorylceramide mannosyltransferase catalytic subunit